MPARRRSSRRKTATRRFEAFGRAVDGSQVEVDPGKEASIVEKQISLSGTKALNTLGAKEYDNVACLQCGTRYGAAAQKNNSKAKCDECMYSIYACTMCGFRSFCKGQVIEHMESKHDISQSFFQDDGETIEEDTEGDDKTDSLFEIDNESSLNDYCSGSDENLDYRSKSKRKSKSKVSLKSPAKGFYVGVSFSTFDKLFEEAMRWTYSQKKLLENQFPLVYSDIMPHSGMFIKINELNLDFHASPPFQITFDEGKKVIKSKGLDAFTSLEISDKSDALVFCAGSPVWCLSWCPIPISGSGSKQYIALSTNSGLHTADTCYHEKTIVQIWDCNVLPIKSHYPVAPKIALKIYLEDGPVWDLKWCNYGKMSPTKVKEAMSRLGILALACSSGKVLVLPVPDPAVHVEFSVGDAFAIKPAMILLPCFGGDIEIENIFGQCLCVDWSVDDGGSFLAGGFSKGLVALWKLVEPSSMLTTTTNGSMEVIAYRTFRAHIKPIFSLCWCPFHTDTLATAAHDRYVRIWNRHDIESPVMEVLAKIGIPTNMCWPSIWCGVFTSTEDVFTGPWWQGLLYHDVLTQFTSPFNVIPFKATCRSLSFSDWMNVALAVDSNGCAVLALCNNMSRKIRHGKMTYRLMTYSTSAQWPNGESEDAKCYISFKDTNLKSLKGLDKRRCVTSVRIRDKFEDPLCSKPFHQAVNSISWNPNFGSQCWYASGLQSGLVRIHSIDALHSSLSGVFDDLSSQ